MLTRFVLAFAAVLLSLPTLATAQMGFAKGRVVDENGAPLAEAIVRFEFLGEVTRVRETTTNKKGEYTQALETGVYRITAEVEGYRGSYVEAKIDMGSPTPVPELRLQNQEAMRQAAVAEILGRFDEASRLMQSGDLDGAEAIYQQLLAEDDSIPELHYNLGTLYARKQDFPAAEAAYRKTLELQPGNRAATIALSRVYESTDRADEGVALLDGLATSSPDDAAVYYELGIAHLNARRIDEAHTALAKVAELDPERVDVQYYLATIMLNKGDMDTAIDHLEAYLASAPESAQYRATATELLSKLKPAQ